ncbi:MAG TPA: alkaline phosphatase family protein [Gemmatimonadales bacterium]|nr:alkaline phosphatase family protein [Gemmatimonadales bacterium]
MNTTAPAPAPGRHPGSPQLAVLIAVDQLRPDYFSRWDPQLTGGLARFWREGAFFTRARQDHALTETAPGHATMLSGRLPARTNIVSNLHGVADPASPLLELKDAGLGASPRRFRGTTLYDWLRAADSSSRVLSVSRKDRGAILPVGRSRGQVYWYTGGIFTTSAWYAGAADDTLPGWVREFNAGQPIVKVAGTPWPLLLPESAYSEPDSQVFENGGRDVAFPHQLTPNIDAAAILVVGYPVMDSLTLAFALRGVERLRLGQGGATDLLVVSLSTTDVVGHNYGPDSREVHDQVLRLDRWLGGFLDSLAVLVPRERTLFALTADHGVSSMPEYLVHVRKQTAGRVWLADLAQELNETVGRAAALRQPFGFEYGLLYGDVASLHRAGVDVDSLAEAVAKKARARPGVAKVFTPASLRKAPAGDDDAALWRRTLPDDFGWVVCAMPQRGWVWSRLGVIAEHGAGHLEDQLVPMAFLGPGIPTRRWQDSVSATDLAPTLAALIGVRPTEPLDGRVLTQVLPARTAR